MKSVTSKELHDLHAQLTAIHEGKRIEPGVAVIMTLGLVLDQRLEEIEKALISISLAIDTAKPAPPIAKGTVVSPVSTKPKKKR